MGSRSLVTRVKDCRSTMTDDEDEGEEEEKKKGLEEVEREREQTIESKLFETRLTSQKKPRDKCSGRFQRFW